jgi:[ribosomal protein S5]-alanine N-acetyltransferase
MPLNVSFTPFPFIGTDRLTLRPITQDDVNEIFFLRSDHRVLEHLSRPPARSLEEASAFIQKISGFEKEGESVTWGISLTGDPTLIGTICIWNIQKEHYRGELGYVLHPDQHRKGIMQEALREVIRYAFSTLKLHSLQARVSPANSASIKLLERNKFIREAYFREDYFFEGRFLDTVVYSLLASDRALSSGGMSRPVADGN